MPYLTKWSCRFWLLQSLVDSEKGEIQRTDTSGVMVEEGGEMGKPLRLIPSWPNRTGKAQSVVSFSV